MQTSQLSTATSRGATAEGWGPVIVATVRRSAAYVSAVAYWLWVPRRGVEYVTYSTSSPFAGLEGHLKAVAVYEAWRQQGFAGAT